MKQSKKKEVIAVIAARGGSKGIPGKNIKKLNGKPLVFYTLKTLSKIDLIDRIIVSTDSAKIKKVIKKLKLKKIEIFNRPKKLSGDKVPLTAVAKYVAETLPAELISPVADTWPPVKILPPVMLAVTDTVVPV